MRRKWRRLRKTGLTILLLVGLVAAANLRYLRYPDLLKAKIMGYAIARTLSGPIRYWWGDLVRTVEVHGDAAYIALGTQMGVLDMTTPSSPHLLETFDFLGVVHGFVRKGEILFCASGSGGLISFDVTSPLEPVVLQTFIPPGYGMHVALVKEDLLLLSYEVAGWYILDVSDPADMVPLSHVEGGWVSSARVDGDVAYILDGHEGVVLYDVSDPAKPVRLGTVPIQLPKDIYEPDPRRSGWSSRTGTPT